MARFQPLARVLLSWIGQGIVGGLAFVAISTVDQSPLRDAVLILIWPLVIVTGTILAWRWLGRPDIPIPTRTVTESEKERRLAGYEAIAERDRYRHVTKEMQAIAEYGRGLRSRFELLPTEASSSAPDHWSEVSNWERQVQSILDNPADLKAFTAAVDPAKLEGQPWHMRLAIYAQIKADLVSQMASSRPS